VEFPNRAPLFPQTPWTVSTGNPNHGNGEISASANSDSMSAAGAGPAGVGRGPAGSGLEGEAEEGKNRFAFFLCSSEIWSLGMTALTY